MKLQIVLLMCAAAGVAFRAMAIGTAPAEIAVKDGDAIAFLGDSITAQGVSKPTGYVNLVMKGLEVAGVKGVKLIPAGAGGNKSNDMLARVDKDCLKKRPRFMTVSCGVNDVWHGLVNSSRGVSLEAFRKNMAQIFDMAASAGVEVVVLTPTLIIHEDETTPANQKLKGYADWLAGEANRRHLRLADLNGDMRQLVKRLHEEAAASGKPTRRLTYDGVHMAFPGNCMMAWGVLRAFGVPESMRARIEAAWRTMPGAYEVSVKLSAEDYERLLQKAGGEGPAAYLLRCGKISEE